MSSLLTNNGAMVALQTLKSINKDMGKTQNMISTGKEVANAKDNAAVWSISKIMETETEGFKAIGDSLNLGQSVVATARDAAEDVTDLLKDMRNKIISAQTEGMDGATLQKDVAALRDQIQSIVTTAEFNGVNLLDGSSTEDMKVVASIDRKTDGTTKAATIDVARSNLSVTGAATNQTLGVGGGRASAFTDNGGGTTIVAAGGTVGNGIAVAAGGALEVTVNDVAANDTFTINLEDIGLKASGGGTATGTRTFHYVANGDDTQKDVAKALQAQVSEYFSTYADPAAGYSVALKDGDPTTLVITNGSGVAVNAGLMHQTGGTPGGAGGTAGLTGLADIDVSDAAGAEAALSDIDGWIKQATDAAAAFGSAQSRIENQSEFMSKLTDNFKSGIGAMVDAQMEEVAAQNQALQVQQQLATQALTIANQAPQAILGLFR